MLTSQQHREFQQADSDLDGLTVERVLDLLSLLSITDRREFTDSMMDTMPALVAELGDVSALLASNFYEVAREQSAARGKFVVDLAEPVAAAQVQATSGWALAPLWTEEPLPQDALVRVVTDRFTISAPRMVRDSGRRTITDNSARDPAKPRYRRVLSAGKERHCDFCRTLASRGFVYHSKDTAGVGKHWHDRCACYVELGFKS